MKRSSFIFLILLALIAVVLAVANQRMVTFSFNPIDTTDPNYAITTELYVVVFAAFALGALVGAVGMMVRRFFSDRAKRQAAKRAGAAQPSPSIPKDRSSP